MPRLVSAAAALLLLDAVAATAQTPPRVVVRVVEPDGTGVQSYVSRRVGEVEVETETDANGRVTFEPLSCTPGTLFRIRSFYPMYANQGGWRACKPELVVILHPIGYASSLAGLLSGDLAEAGSPAGEAGADARARLAAAAETGRWGAIAFEANELAAIHRASGDAERAAAYGALAIESGGRAIAAAAGAPVAAPLLVEERAGLIESQAANAVLKDFQADRALPPTGQWDYRTFAAIRALDDAAPAIAPGSLPAEAFVQTGEADAEAMEAQEASDPDCC